MKSLLLDNENHPRRKNKANIEKMSFLEGGCQLAVSDWPMISPSTKPTLFPVKISQERSQISIAIDVMLIAAVVLLPLYQFTCLKLSTNCCRKDSHLSKEAVMIFLIRAENRGMEKTQLVSWQSKPGSCNRFILQPWRCCLLFTPFYTDLSLNCQLVIVEFAGLEIRFFVDGNTVHFGSKTEAIGEKYGVFQGGCPSPKVQPNTTPTS